MVGIFPQKLFDSIAKETQKPVCHQAVLVHSQTNLIRKKGNHFIFTTFPVTVVATVIETKAICTWLSWWKN